LTATEEKVRDRVITLSELVIPFLDEEQKIKEITTT
jgi:phage/plasmid-associated DNA primase